MSRFQNLVSFFAPPAADAPSPLPPRHYDRRFLHFLRAPQDFLYNDTIGSGKFKDIFRFEVLRRRVIVCVNPAAIKHVLVDNHRNYAKSNAFKVLEQMLGQGLLTSEGSYWQRQRRLMQPAFHKKRLEAVAEITTEATNRWLEKQLLLKNEPIDFAREMVALTIEIVTKALFGSNLTHPVEDIWSQMNFVNKTGIMRIRNPFQPPSWVPTAANRRVNEAVKLIDRVTLDIINTRRNNPAPSDDLLQMLLDVQDEDTGERMSDRQIRDEVITLFVAGHETTVNALTWCVYELGKNADVLAKAKQEVATVLQGKTPTFDDVMRLPYVNNLINETLRLYPPAYAIPREAIADDTILGYHIPKGTPVMLNVLAMHRHPDYWDEPLTFKPERFENLDLKGDRKYTFFPFGGGPRLCIGNNFALMEMVLILTVLLQKTDIELLTKTVVHEDFLLTLKPKSPIMVNVRKVVR